MALCCTGCNETIRHGDSLFSVVMDDSNPDQIVCGECFSKFPEQALKSSLDEVLSSPPVVCITSTAVARLYSCTSSSNRAGRYDEAGFKRKSDKPMFYIGLEFVQRSLPGFQPPAT